MTNQNLKKPGPDAELHSKKLYQHIAEKIKQSHGQQIPFNEFMNEALYAPGLGYYTAGAHKFGAQGDFVTAPEISPLFSRCLAKQCAEALKNIPQGSLLEFGAGSGKMAADLLLYLEKLNHLPEHYFILEVSADLKQRQQVYLKKTCISLFDRFVWLDTLPEHFSGVMLANEVIDAMPVNMFHYDKNKLQECYITLNKDKLDWRLDEPSDALQKAFNHLQNEADMTQWHTPYQSEISLMAPAWINSLADSLKQGVIFLIDYGFVRREYYHPQRNQGTLMCHYQHHAYTDPLKHVGIQDITAHVDFTAIVEAAIKNNLDIEGFVTQADFLLSCGITDLLSDIKDPADLHNAKQAIKKLTLPSEMGEFFKVLGLSKNFEGALMGFENNDISHKL